MLRLRYVLLLGVALLFQGTTISGATYHKEYKKNFSFRQGGKLILENTNGAVRVDSWDRNEVRVVAKKKVKAGSRRKAKEFMEKVKIEVESHGDNYLTIRTEYPKVKESFWDAIFGDDGISVNVSYQLMVPKDLTMEIKTVNGSINISEVAGRIEARTTNGAIKIIEAKGQVNAKTTNGGIDAELLDFNENENMSFKTTNGGIKVYFPSDFRGNIEAKTTNGRVVTDFPIKVIGKVGRRKLKGEINGGGGRIKLHTTNGGIKILEL